MKNILSPFKILRNPIFLGILFLVSSLYAQDICKEPILNKDFQVSLEGTFINRSKSRTHIDILWKHHNSLDADTFAIHIPKEDSLYYITNGNSRTLYSPKLKASRQMALHHLKEFIGKTPLRFDDLELLAHGAFLCPKDSAQKLKRLTAFSQMWFTLIQDKPKEPESLTMFGARGSKRIVKILEWKKFEEVLLPSVVQVSSKEDCGTIWIHSAYAINKSPINDPLLEIIKNSKLTTILHLDNKLLPQMSIVESGFSSDKKSWSQSNSVSVFSAPRNF